MTDLPPAHTIKRHGQWDHADDSCVLTYDDRFLRRKRLLTSHNRGFLVDLAHTESLNHGDAFELEGGQTPTEHRLPHGSSQAAQGCPTRPFHMRWPVWDGGERP
mgnify:CR=1 FL=1